MLDSSYSISNSPGGEDQVKGAAKSFLNALKDTSSRAGIVQFSTKVNVKRDVVPLTLVTSASTSGNGTHAAAINRYVTDGATNWQDAFINAKRLFDLSPRNVPKLAVLVTDGSPNTYNLTPTTAAPLVPDADPAALDPAIVAMNALKAEGVHTLAIGAGKVYTTDAKQQQFRAALQSVSGPDVYPDAAFDARTTDLVLEPDYQAGGDEAADPRRGDLRGQPHRHLRHDVGERAEDLPGQRQRLGGVDLRLPGRRLAQADAGHRRDTYRDDRRRRHGTVPVDAERGQDRDRDLPGEEGLRA